MCVIHTTQVVWLGKPVTDSTWETAESLPTTLVQEYESGIVRDIQKESFTTGGQTVHTLSTVPVTRGEESTTKRLKIDLAEHDSLSSGYGKYLMCVYNMANSMLVKVITWLHLVTSLS